MSPLRTLFLFAGEHDQKAHVLSSDMLKSYLARKYIEPLESVPLTKRAVDAVVADFERHAGSRLEALPSATRRRSQRHEVARVNTKDARRT